MRHVFAVLALLAGAIPAHAATTSGPPSNYDVEVVVFENRLPALDGGELWPRENLRSLATDIAAAVETQAPDEGAPLAAAAKALAADGGHRVLAHRRWTQAAEARSAAQVVRLNAGETLDGVLRFYLSRFLHIDVNLVLVDGAGSWRDENFAGVAYRLSEHRRVKTQEINYFDHPKFGVIVRVTQEGKP